MAGAERTGVADRALMEARYGAAATFGEFLRDAEAHAELWRRTYALARVPDEIVERLRTLSVARHLLVLLEDWCGDAVNTIPLVARLAEASPQLDLRVLGRDANPDLMDTHLTGAARAIPVVMVLDEHYRELAWWGPRPAPLQVWVKSDVAQGLSPGDRYKEIRRWYARDRGRTTLEEIMALLERGNLVADAA